MREKLNSLQSTVLDRISKAAQTGNIDQVTELSSKATKLKELLVAYDRLENEVSKIENGLNGANGISHAISVPREVVREPNHGYATRKGGRRGQTCLEVEIDWSKNGQPYGKEVFRERFASDTLVALMKRLNEVLGERALQTGSSLSVNRGPFLSIDPENDYLNRATGKVYQSNEIPGTGYYVLTNTDTDQKVRDVMGLLKKLGLATGSFSVRKIDR